MWEVIVSTFLKYWVEFVLAGVGAGIIYFVKKYMKLNNEALKRSQEEYHDKIKKDIIDKNQEMIHNMIEKSVEDDARLQNEINAVTQDLALLKSGVLQIQGKDFKNQCRHLLEDSHTITLDEWEEIDSAHQVYNSLGGNHKGDELFELVKKKAANHIAK